MAKIRASYVKVVTEDTLDNQDGLGICMAWFAFLCGILVHIPNRSFFNFRTCGESRVLCFS